MAKLSMTNLSASFVNLCIILCAVLSLLFFPRAGSRPRPRWKICKRAA